MCNNLHRILYFAMEFYGLIINSLILVKNVNLNSLCRFRSFLSKFSLLAGHVMSVFIISDHTLT